MIENGRNKRPSTLPCVCESGCCGVPPKKFGSCADAVIDNAKLSYKRA